MPGPQTARELLRAIRYEHWLRFYFAELPPEAAQEDSGTVWPEATLRVPAEWVETARREDAELYPLLERLQGRSISMDTARQAVFDHVSAPAEDLFQLVEDPDFRRGLDAFHGWVQALANSETHAGPDRAPGDETPVSFSVWEKTFQIWSRENAIPHVTAISPMPGEPS